MARIGDPIPNQAAVAAPKGGDSLITQTPENQRQGELVVVGEFLIGLAVLWLVLNAMTESPVTADLGAAIAVAVAGSATVLFAVDAINNLGLGPQ